MESDDTSNRMESDDTSNRMESDDTSTKLGHCQICEEELAKYKCPRCQLCTCSLACVNTHKTQSECSGVRNRIGLIQKRNMNNFTLLSDYRFLEEIDHKLDDNARNPHRRAICKGKESFEELPFHLKKLKISARKRGTVIEFMPKHFSMHRQNTTRFIIAENKIRWHLKWVFPQADLTFIEECVNEDTLVVDLLKKYMEPLSRLDENETSSISAEDSQKLCYYHSASYRRIAVLLQSSLCYRDKRYTELFLSKSLKVNFANRKIVEYPIFYVVLRDHVDAYLDNYESDDDLTAVLSRNQVPETCHVSDTVENFDRKTVNKTIPRVTRRDGGLSFFDAYSDNSDENE